ncbi:hypothetical protein V8E54_000999 [Elaphomyces granulatus]
MPTPWDDGRWKNNGSRRRGTATWGSAQLQTLYTSNASHAFQFRKNIRRYNRAIAFRTSPQDPWRALPPPGPPGERGRRRSGVLSSAVNPYVDIYKSAREQ